MTPTRDPQLNRDLLHDKTETLSSAVSSLSRGSRGPATPIPLHQHSPPGERRVGLAGVFPAVLIPRVPCLHPAG